MKEFNKANLGIVREEMEEALKLITEAHGINFEIGNIRFNASTFSCKIDASVDSADNKSTSAYNDARVFNPKLPAFGSTIKLGSSEVMEIVGFKPRSHKYPVLAKDLSNNKTYKLSIRVVEEATVIK